MRRVIMIIACAGFCCCVAKHAAGQANFQPLGRGDAWAISRNGQFVLMKRSNGDVHRWSPATGQVAMGFNIGGLFLLSCP
jgi:hypothetical protein